MESLISLRQEKQKLIDELVRVYFENISLSEKVKKVKPMYNKIWDVEAKIENAERAQKLKSKKESYRWHA